MSEETAIISEEILAPVEVTHIGVLKSDQRNPRKHTPRNIGMIEDSLQEGGAWRSIAIDEENNIIAGNGTIEAAGNVGITRLKIVEAEGDEIVAVRRRGLTDRQKYRAKVFDNRSAELALWDAEVMGDMEELDGAIHEGLFYDKEMERLLSTAAESLPAFEPGSGLTGEENGRLRDGQAVSAAGLPVSQVKLVQLLYTPEQMQAFDDACAALAKQYNTDNPTDTVLAVLMDAHARVKKEAA